MARTRTSTTLKKVKVRQLLDTSASKPWKELDQDLKNGKNNPLIANSKAGPLISTFSAVVSAITPFFTVSKAVERVKPIIGAVVKVIGAIRNPAYIPDIAQDVIVKVQSLILKKIVTSVTSTGNKILNTEINFKNITIEQLEELQEAISSFQDKTEDTVSKVLNEFTYEPTRTNNQIGAQNNTFDNSMSAIENNVSLAIDALDTSGMTEQEVREAILQIVSDEILGSTELNVIVPTDEELFRYVDTEVKKLRDSLNEEISSGISAMSLDTSSTTSSMDSESANTFNAVKDGFQQMATTVVEGNKEGIFETAGYKENEDIIKLVEQLKVLIDIEVRNLKNKFYEDIKSFLQTQTNIETMKSGSKTIVMVRVDIYKLLAILLRKEIRRLQLANEEAKYIFEESDDVVSKYYSEKNDLAFKEAGNIFDNYKVDLIRYLLAGYFVFLNSENFPIPLTDEEVTKLKNNETDRVVSAKGKILNSSDIQKAKNFFFTRNNFKLIIPIIPALEENQINFSADIVTIIKTNIVSIINDLEVFNYEEPNEFFSVVPAIIQNATTVPSINTSITDETVCFKVTKFKANVYHGYKEKICGFYETVPQVLGELNFVSSSTVTEEKIKKYIKDITRKYLEDIMALIIDVIIKGAVPCRKCISCEKIAKELIRKIEEGINNFKTQLIIETYKDYSNLVFTDVFEDNKNVLLSYFNGPTFYALMYNLADDYFGVSFQNKTFASILSKEHKKMLSVIIEKMEEI